MGGIAIAIFDGNIEDDVDKGAADIIARCVASGENRALPLPEMVAVDMEAKDDSDVTACGVIVLSLVVVVVVVVI